MRLDKKRATGPRTPVRSNGLATRARIVQAATELLGTDGGTITLRSLAAHSGVSPAAIYQFFQDLDAVGAAVIEAASAEFRMVLEAALTSDLARADPRRFFERLIQEIGALQARRPETLCMVRAAGLEGLRGALAGELRMTVARHVHRTFAEAHPHVDPADLARTLSIVQHAVIGALAGVPDRLDPRRGAYLTEVATLAGTYLTNALGKADSGQGPG